jgi:hypothetical protein
VIVAQQTERLDLSLARSGHAKRHIQPIGLGGISGLPPGAIACGASLTGTDPTSTALRSEAARGASETSSVQANALEMHKPSPLPI